MFELAMPVPTPALTPLQRYRVDLEREDFHYDESQQNAVKQLQRLYDDLLSRRNLPKPKLIDRIGKRFKKTKVIPVQGLYFWGGVGRGKTYLMDVFYDALNALEQALASGDSKAFALRDKARRMVEACQINQADIKC